MRSQMQSLGIHLRESLIVGKAKGYVRFMDHHQNAYRVPLLSPLDELFNYL